MSSSKPSSRLKFALGVSAAIGIVGAGFLASIALRGGTHASYCPAASAVWIFRCVPTLSAVSMFAFVAAMIALPFLVLLMTVLGVGRR